MPWTIEDVPEKYKGNKSAAEMWVKVANSALEEYGDEGKAKASASSAVNKKYNMTEMRRFVEAFPETFEGTRVRMQLFKTGHWEGHPDGPFDVTKGNLEVALRNFKDTGRALPVDFDHGLDYGSTPEERRAAGWIKDLELTDDGLYAEFDATSEAAEWIKGGQYRFISPTYSYSFTNKESGEDQGFTLLRAALTNVPFFDGMHPCVAMNERTSDAIASATVKVYEENAKLRAENAELKVKVQELRGPVRSVRVQSEHEATLSRRSLELATSLGRKE